MARSGMRVWLSLLAALTIVLHIAQVTWYPPDSVATPHAGGPVERGRNSATGGVRVESTEAAHTDGALTATPTPLPPLSSPAVAAASRGGRLLLVTASQPAPCNTRRGDWLISLSTKNKWQYASLHGHALWLSTELLSPWDLSGQWNKVALLSALLEEGAGATEAEWLLWMDDDAIFVDMHFELPLERYEAEGVHLVLWGDERMTYEEGNTEGVNTGTMLLRRCEWSRRLLSAMTAVASSALRSTLTNHDQGGLVHLLHTQPEVWRPHTRLERSFTMNGHWPEYAGRLGLGMRELRAAVWGSVRLPLIVHYSGCQMCRGHSFNGTWTDAGVAECERAFLEAFVFADDLALARIGVRHTRLGLMGVRPANDSWLKRRHTSLTRCLPAFLVVGTQKGGTSTLHYVLAHGWQPAVQVNAGEKEVHHFSFDDNFARGATVYQQRWDGEAAALGECPGAEGRVRGEVSASYLDYPKAAERAAALLPFARVLVLLREPVGRLVSSYNMRWQVEVCGRLTWTRRDCYLGITSRELVRDNAVGPFQRASALKVWTKCNEGEARLSLDCLRADFVGKLSNRTAREMRELEGCLRAAVPEPLMRCLGLHILGQRKLYKKMEDNAYVYRSMYVEHLSNWLNYFPPSQLLVLPSEELFDPGSIERAMAAISDFLRLPAEAARREVLFTASPASTDAAPHENGRVYVAEAPPELTARLQAWLCPHNQRLADLLVEHALTRQPAQIPWLTSALEGCRDAQTHGST